MMRKSETVAHNVFQLYAVVVIIVLNVYRYAKPIKDILFRFNTQATIG
jgi:hypothetical protein